MNAAWLPAAALALALGDSASSAQSLAAPRPPAARPVTFARDVAPIVSTHCVGCHRPGGSAPFSLMTYPEVRGRARQIVEAVEQRAMPPWKPEPGYGEFAGERRLTRGQIAVFREWLATGLAAGDLRRTPPAPPANEGWRLGKPDVVLRLSAPYRLAASGRDQLRNFVVPIPTSVRRYVRAWEFRPTSPAVHHATLLIDSSGESRRLDDDDPEPGYEGLIPLSARNPDGYFLGWTPGHQPYLAPERLAWLLDPGTDLVAMLHLLPSGQAETVDATIALYFSSRPPVETPVMVRLNRQDIDIPAGQARYTAADTYTLPVPVTVFGVQPHAHNLAREVRGLATLPDGTTKWLVYIRDWDFHWQDHYRLTTPLPLPAGTVLSMEFVYDNSDWNPANPSTPPRRVTFGQRTTDEMGDLWVQVLPDRRADAGVLASDLRRHQLPRNIAGLQMMARTDPDNAGIHDDLALLYAETGDFERAAEQFGESLRLRPNAPAALYNVGNALVNLRRWPEAADYFRRAIALSPDYGPAHHGLAIVLQAQGRRDEALAGFERALRLMPTADVHHNVGVLRQARGDFEEARAHYREAVRLNPQSAESHLGLAQVIARRGEAREAAAAFRRALQLRRAWPAAELGLAWLLATSPDRSVRDPRKAVALAQQALTVLGGDDAHALDIAAAAYASIGEFRRAIASAKRALGLITAAGDAETAAAVAERLALYEQGRPFVDRLR